MIAKVVPYLSSAGPSAFFSLGEYSVRSLSIPTVFPPDGGWGGGGGEGVAAAGKSPTGLSSHDAIQCLGVPGISNNIWVL